MKRVGQKSGLMLASLLLCFPAVVSAAGGQQSSWIIPSNIRIVQKDNVDGVKTFSRVQDAVTNIGSAATASNPYLIKVEPGIYSETVDMSGTSNIYLIGSSKENTKITSSSDTGTLKVGNNTSIENIAVENTSSSTGEGAAAIVIGSNAMNVVINGVNATGNVGGIYSGISDTNYNGTVTITNSKASASSVNAMYGIMFGYNGTHNVKIDNVTVSRTGGSGTGGGLLLWSGGTSAITIEASNSKFLVSSSSCSGRLSGIENYGQQNGVLKLNGVVVESDGGSCNIKGVQATEGKTVITNSKITASGVGAHAIEGTNNYNSTIFVGYSQIVGEIIGMAAEQGDKLLGCYDGSFVPILFQ